MMLTPNDFDLTADLREMKNLITDPARQTEIATAKKRLAELVAQYQDTEVLQTLKNQIPSDK